MSSGVAPLALTEEPLKGPLEFHEPILALDQAWRVGPLGRCVKGAVLQVFASEDAVLNSQDTGWMEGRRRSAQKHDPYACHVRSSPLASVTDVEYNSEGRLSYEGGRGQRCNDRI